MFLYTIVPSCIAVAAFEAKIGWRVHISMKTVLEDLEQRYHENVRSGRYINKRDFSPTVIHSEIPDECRLHHGFCGTYLIWDQHDEPMLAKAVRNWRRVSQEDVLAWEVETKFLENTIPRFVFKEQWWELLPPTSGVPPKPIEYRHEGRARPDQKGVVRRKVRARAGY